MHLPHNQHKKKIAQRERRARRVRARIRGTQARPRLTVYRSNYALYCQLIDDERGVTLAHASSRECTPESTVAEGAKEEPRAFAVGKLVAERAKAQGVTQVVFDRSGYAYHGKIKALAEGARAGGLSF